MFTQHLSFKHVNLLNHIWFTIQNQFIIAISGQTVYSIVQGVFFLSPNVTLILLQLWPFTSYKC